MNTSDVEAAAAELLTEHEEWRAERADLSANDGPGTDPDDWAASDDAGCDLADRLAATLADLLDLAALRRASDDQAGRCPR